MVYLLEPLIEAPVKGAAFLLLILSFVAMWVKRQFGFWFILFVASFVAAYYSGIVELRAAIPVGLLLVAHLFLLREWHSLFRLFLVMVVTLISLALLTHFIQGFHNILLLSLWKSSPDAIAMNFYMNYDKPLAAIFVLGFSLPLIHTKRELLRTLAFTAGAAVLAVTTLLFFAYYFELVVFDPKFPVITPLFLLLQLFFVALPEEVFFRGFLQREIAKDIPTKLGAFLSIVVTSLIFTMPHAFVIQNLAYLLLTFVASLFYGLLFQITNRIESSILLHFTVNTVHFFFFTYPILHTRVGA
jgi:membrane protease YdiL (CAAX protease family)